MTAFDVLEMPLEGRTLVEASAGTGKTSVITTLFVRLIVERRFAVDEILVVTFTEAATAELRDRVRVRLSDALRAFEQRSMGGIGVNELDELARRSADPLTAASMIAAALRDFDRAAIHTIHGFCQRTLREAAFESGVPFDVELLLDSRALVDELVTDFWARELMDAPEEQVRALRTAKVDLELCRKLAERVTRRPDMPVLPERAEPTSGIELAALVDGERLRLQFLQNLVDFVRTELPRRKGARGVLSFDDLLYRLHRALRGPHGRALSRSIRARHPAVLIDEFQDTDPVQYAIFREIQRGPFPSTERQPALFLIGDPKQAIYGFRGADVYAYLDAAEHTPKERRSTMDVNYRADDGLVGAVSGLFAGLERPFLIEGIELPEVRAARQKDAFSSPTASSAALEVLYMPCDGPGPIKKGAVIVPGLVAAEIADLLKARATLDGRAVTPADIAVLTRTNAQAFEVQAALSELGIATVVLGDASVFERPEAGELAQLLGAVADPSDRGALRAALTGPLLGLTARDLVRIRDDEAKWDDWIAKFRAWNETWTSRGLVPMFRLLLTAGEVQARVLGRPDGERRMTNLLHLVELCHAAERDENLGPAGLVHWLHEQRRGTSDDPSRSEAAQVRLERDERAVKLLTVHKSKGLEWPIVYLPYAWSDIGLRDAKSLLAFHDPTHGERLVLDIDRSAANRDQKLALAEWEHAAENLRLLYVALTRAKHRVSLVWGGFDRAKQSALGYVLGWPRDRVPRTADYKAIVELLARKRDPELLADLEARVRASGGRIAVRRVSPRPGTALAPERASMPELACRVFERTVDYSHRIASFSELIASALDSPAKTTALAEQGLDHDEIDDFVVAPRVTVTEVGPPIGLVEFPRGARAGNFFHEILERLDFTGQQGESCELLVDRKLAEYGWDKALATPACRAISALLDTPLGRAPNAFKLSQIGLRARLSELEFHLPVCEKGERLTRGAIASVLRDHPSAELPAEYAERILQLGFSALRGFLKGYIDLVFVQDERWFVVDWKTNHLGDRLGAYAHDRLRFAMSQGHYYLQYHLYTVALHRYLQKRLGGYDYDRHFGGVYYLFIKGMTPETGPERGVFFERPPRGRIEALSERIRGNAPVRGAG